MRAAVSLWRFTFVRATAAMLALLLMVGSAGFWLVMWPVLERPAQSLAVTLLPSASPDCTSLKARLGQLAADPASGIHLRPGDARPPQRGGRLLPFDSLLTARLRARSGRPIEASSSLQALHLRLSCDGRALDLVVDRSIALGADPGLALLAWLGGLAGAALGIAAWLSRALNTPLRRLMAHLRGTPLGAAPATAALTGIRELDQLSLEVDALRERAGDAVASRTALLMGISHDLRTPLARVRLILDTAQPVTDADRAEMQAHVLEMQQAMDEFMRAANAMAAAPVDGGARSVWLRLQVLFTDPRLEFTRPEGDFDTPLNSAALLRIASNLIDNAMRHGKGRVAVSWRHQAGAWRLSVSDEGPGIAPENIQHVLRPFNSGAVNAEDGYRHAGVGLALARILCEHNGWALHLVPGQPCGLPACVEPLPAA